MRLSNALADRGIIAINSERVERPPPKLEALLGSWRLEMFEIDDGSGFRAWRENYRGLLLYAADGHMSVAITGAASGADTRDDMLFYAGRFTVEPGGVTHHVNVASDPLRVGKSLYREVSLVEDWLHLSGERPDGLRSRLRWRRAQPTTP